MRAQKKGKAKIHIFAPLRRILNTTPERTYYYVAALNQKTMFRQSL